MAPHQSPGFTILISLCIFSPSIIGTAVTPHGYHSPQGNWQNHGGDIYNRRYAYGETKISPSTASKLRLKWKFNVGGSVSATPAIYDGILYFTSWTGYLYAVKACDGSLVWRKSVRKLTGISGGQVLGTNTTIARSTPTVAGDENDMLIIGITGPA
ncbi:hypothetical protein ACH5RR_014327 [Cinchona calisaya]|uniref:Uncharacterized protein n=1 Tax=Cinchona calisaya TaxID=153742 RepID=A0ABD3A5Y5_9GENT